ncbi:MAG TPA: HipA family kinase [Solirubrobacteraceae bacterium]
MRRYAVAEIARGASVLIEAHRSQPDYVAAKHAPFRRGTVRAMWTDMALRSVAASRYVTPLREGGSLPGLVEADDDGLYVAKFRGAGQGVLALVAEVIVGELARALGFSVPELVALEVDAALGAAEPDPEIKDLMGASAGLNLGVDFLPGALAYAPGGPCQPSAEQAAGVVWLDALVTNVDRSARNPNLLIWHGRMWLIDHGAALYRQHAGLLTAEEAERPFTHTGEHVLLGRAGSILGAHERLAADAAASIAGAVALVPQDWLRADERDVYIGYLARRLQTAGFAREAENARLSA